MTRVRSFATDAGDVAVDADRVRGWRPDPKAPVTHTLCFYDTSRESEQTRLCVPFREFHAWMAAAKETRKR